MWPKAGGAARVHTEHMGLNPGECQPASPATHRCRPEEQWQGAETQAHWAPKQAGQGKAAGGGAPALGPGCHPQHSKKNKSEKSKAQQDCGYTRNGSAQNLQTKHTEALAHPAQLPGSPSSQAGDQRDPLRSEKRQSAASGSPGGRQGSHRYSCKSEEGGRDSWK